MKARLVWIFDSALIKHCMLKTSYAAEDAAYSDNKYAYDLNTESGTYVLDESGTYILDESGT